MGVAQLLLQQHLSFFFFLPTETKSWPRCKVSPATKNSRITGASGKSNRQILWTYTIPKPQQQQQQQQQLLKPCGLVGKILSRTNWSQPLESEFPSTTYKQVFCNLQTHKENPNPSF
jgi:hypothetical protein